MSRTRKNDHLARAERFYNETEEHNPGPGRYEPRQPKGSGIKFTIAKRTSLFHIYDSPSPDSYNLPSTFNDRSCTFSPKLSKSMPHYPGPGTYDVKDIVRNNARAVFGKEKRKDNFLNMELVNIPAPGRYTLRDTLSEGPQWKFGTDRSRKFQAVEDFPGPGAYDSQTLTKTMAFKFPSGRKNTRVPKLPGPGQYNIGSFRSSGFSMPRAEKHQKFSGPPLPGPSDYFYTQSTLAMTPNSAIQERRSNYTGSKLSSN